MTDAITVGFAGMTHLGLVSATGTCAKGFDVVCFDEDPALVSRLQQGELPVVEPDLPETIAGNAPRQVFTAEVGELGRCDVVYIAPDVPTDDTGASDLAGVEALIATVCANLSEHAILVVLCQVPPGFTRSIAQPPERLYYQVETLIFGRALERATQPERFIVGCADPDTRMAPAFRTVLEAFQCPILPMRYESAELAKISINMCLVASVSVANTLAELCERIGAVWTEIVPALKLDRRIGEYSYLNAGMGIAGGNLERDLATVVRFANRYDTDAGVIEAFIHNSAHRKRWAAETFNRQLRARFENCRVGIWGLAYKENTHSVKNSPSLATIAELSDIDLVVHDPVVDADMLSLGAVTKAEDPLDALVDRDVLMVLTPWQQYREVDPIKIRDCMSGNVLVDPYKVIDRDAALAAGLEYVTIGRIPEKGQ